MNCPVCKSNLNLISSILLSGDGSDDEKLRKYFCVRCHRIWKTSETILTQSSDLLFDKQNKYLNVEIPRIDREYKAYTFRELQETDNRRLEKCASEILNGDARVLINYLDPMRRIEMTNNDPFSEMKGINIVQPWANLVALGQKSMILLDSNLDYRGPVIIVASDVDHKAANKLKNIATSDPCYQSLAIATIADCRPMNRSDVWFARTDFNSKKYSLVLKNIKKIKPFYCKRSVEVFNIEIPTKHRPEIERYLTQN